MSAGEQAASSSRIRRLLLLVWGSLLVSCGARSTDAQSHPHKHGTTDMANAELDEFHTCDVLVGFFQVVAADSRYTFVFGKDEGWTETTMSVFGPDGDGHNVQLRKLTEPGIDIRGVDGRVVDRDLLLAIEDNGYKALQWARLALADLPDPAKTLVFGLVWEGGLSAADALRVDLPAANGWNVATPLPPKQWLFGPRFVAGKDAVPEVVVNAADGQVVLLHPSGPATDAAGEARFLASPSPGGPKGTLSPVTGAFAPRACMVNGTLVVSLLRPGGPTHPFKLTERLQAGVPPSGAALVVVEDGKEEHDLSTKLDLGLVIEHALVPGRDGSLWLFALRDADVGTEVVALHRRGPAAWEVRGRKPFTRDLWRVSALAGDAELWHLVLAEKRQAGWALHELRWKI